MKYFFSILWVLLLSAANAQDEDYVSLQDRLKSNIFLKVDASSTDCFVGEPIIVTYKLYSAMASESNIVRTPAFDGFNVRDLKGSTDNMASRETVDGVKFDVHTLLRLQLTPQRAGRLTLGSLMVQNRVKLVDANGNEDPILSGVEEGYTLNNGYFTLPVSSVPITVLVTALPGSSQPASGFNGLVGDFKMDVQLSKKVLAPGEQAALTIMITGRGDFGKIEQPEIEWPKAADLLAAKVDEDKIQKPDGSGFKSFTIPFTINAPGKYAIPSIKFSFFDALSSKYKTITNIPVEFDVVNEGATGNVPDTITGEKKDYQTVWIGVAVLAIVFAVLGLIMRYRKKKRLAKPAPVHSAKNDIIEINPTGLSVQEALQPAPDSRRIVGSAFGTSLKQGIHQYLQTRFGIKAQLYSTEQLQQELSNKGVSSMLQGELIQLLTQINMNFYSGGGTEADKETLLAQARKLLDQL